MSGVSKLIPALDFPDDITPAGRMDFRKLAQAFGIQSERPQSAEIVYERLSAQIAALTGHEFTTNRHGRAFSRAQWHENLHKSLSYINERLHLGLKRPVVDMLALCYTVLQESPRYRGEPVIEQHKGENTAVHSLHTPLQAFRIFQKALETQPLLGEDVDFFRSFQMICLTMLVHDLGEMFGEAGSLAQVVSAGSFDVKDKTAFERAVFTHGVRLAISCAIDGAISEKDFFDRIDRIKGNLNVQNQGTKKSDEQMAGEVKAQTGEDVTLSRHGQNLFAFLLENWEGIENPDHSRHPFLYRLGAVCERVQGTRHLNRMITSCLNQVMKDDGSTEDVLVHSLSVGRRLTVNAQYCEGHVGELSAETDENSEMEKTLRRFALEWVYQTSIDFFEKGPEAFFLKTYFINETPRHEDGSPFSPREARQRQEEIKLARAVATYEAEQIAKSSSRFQSEFSGAAGLPMGLVALRREDVVELYRRALATGYVPGIVEDRDPKTGKIYKRGEILLLDRPAALTGLMFDREAHKRDAYRHIENLERAARPT